MNQKEKIESGFSYQYNKNSGLIRSHRHNWKKDILEIGFSDKTFIWYYGVSDSVFSSLSISDDLDSYFEKNIKNKFKSEKFEDDFSDDIFLHSTFCLNRIHAYYFVGDYEKMISFCDRMIEKKSESGDTNFSMENMEKAKAFCKLGRYAEVIPLLEKQTGIYASHLKIYAYMKMNRLDQALKLLRRLAKSRGKDGLYIGRIDFPEVHQLFIEMAVISSLKRPLSDDEKQVISDILNKQKSSFDPSFVSLVSKECEKLTLHLDIEQIENTYQSIVEPDTPSKYLLFDDARQFVQKLNLDDEKSWKKYSISSERPENIPLNPKKEYALEWKSWNDWLGITKRKYLSFEDAKNFVKSQNLESEQEWKLFYKSGKLPQNIPINPRNVYTSKWNGWDDWLGNLDRDYLSFEEAKKEVGKLFFEYSSEWKTYCKSGNKPKNIPAKPDLIYKDNWVDWDNWLGVFDRTYLSYGEQREFVSKLNFTSSSQWTEYAKSGNKPKNIPAKPFKYFGDFLKIEFDFYDWLGMNKKTYIPFEDARKYVRSLKLKNYEEFRAWSDSDKRPENIPANPSYIYREKGWYGYEDYAGIPH